jgi:arginyl-tRNA synthetase
MSLVDRVRSTIILALNGVADADVVAAASWTVERPKRAEHGDLATNVALVIQKTIGKPPRAIAEHLVKALEGSDVVAKAEIAGPGFVNLRLHPSAFHAGLGEVLAAGKSYGRAPSGSGERINLEFVSANPTGPLLVSHGRGAIFGDAVARLLEATGHRVTREYYINDFGNQVRLFAESVRAVADGRDVPEDGYKGAYIVELAHHLKSVDPAIFKADQATLARTCVTWMLRGIPGSKDLPGIKTTLRDLGVEFDVWFSEESLHRWGHVDVALRLLRDKGYLVEKEGALFFKAEEGTDDKDRVVKKSDGDYTYFASDIAYFADKVSRGYDRLMITLGADHHGYVARVRNSLAALGLPSERFEALLYQLVFLFRDGQPVKFSKRQGNIVTVEEVAEEIDEAAARKGAGRDALRFFFLTRTANTNVEFDIDLAKKKSLDNPVFYVQYGYARLCSILSRAEELGFKASHHLTPAEWSKLTHPDELAIAQRLGEFPALVADAAKGREPHKIVFYIQDLANAFQSYYTRQKNAEPVLPPKSVRAAPGWEKTWDHDKTRARLAWIEAIRTVYAAGLDLLGVSAPERMDLPPSAQSDGESGAGGESGAAGESVSEDGEP